MDNIGDWLYIVLMALAVISSLISAARKKKQEAEKQNLPYPDEETADDEQAGRDSWEVMREMQEREEARQREIRRQQEAQAARSASRQVKATPSTFLSGEKISSRLSRPSVSSLPAETDTPPILTEGAFNDPEELRKAVIYTEILNRKY